MTPTVRLTIDVAVGSADYPNSVASAVLKALRAAGIQAEVIVASTPTVSIAYLSVPNEVPSDPAA